MENYGLAVSSQYNTGANVPTSLINKEEARNHLNIILHSIPKDAGFIEIRTLAERGKPKDKFPRSYFVPTNATAEQIEAAILWSEKESVAGRGVFIGMNPREREEKTKDAVKLLSTVFLDLDLDKKGIDREEALAEVKDVSLIPPTYILNSGGGLHVAFFFKPTEDYDKWIQLQTAIYEKFKHVGADESVVTDSSRILRLAGFPNWKYETPRTARIVEFTPREDMLSFNAISDLFDVDFSAKKQRKRHELPKKILEGGDGVTHEGRNRLMHSEVGRLRHWGYEEEEIVAALLAINESRCVPPLPESVVRDMAKRAVAKYPKDHELTEGIKNDETALDLDRLFPTWGVMSEADYASPEYLIYGLPRGGVGMISGVTNFGKSLLIRNLAISLASGREYLNILKSGEPRKVLLLDYETPVSVYHSDIRKMMTDFSDVEKNAVAENLRTYTNLQMDMPTLNLSENEHFQTVEKMAGMFKPDVIIVDTVSAAFTIKSENDNGEITALMKRLQQLAKTADAVVLFAHHIGKSGSEEGNASNSHYRARGASSFHGASLAVLQLDEKTSGKDKVRTMKYAKVKDKKPNEVILIENEETRWFEIDGSGRLAFSRADEKYQKLLEIIKQPMTKKEIVEKTNFGTSTVEKYLTRAVDSNHLENPRWGLYQPFGWIPFEGNTTNH